MHELRLSIAGTVKTCRFMVSSPLGDFAETLDHFNDAYDWIWDGGWTESLEEAIVLLLVALDDHFTAFEAMLKSNMMLQSMLSMLECPKGRIEKYMATALESHDIYALGRAVSAARQFLLAQNLIEMFAPMLGGGGRMAAAGESPFYEALLAFEKARQGAASQAK